MAFAFTEKPRYLYGERSGKGAAAWFELADGPVAPLYKMSQPQGRPDILRIGIPISENYLLP